MRFIFAHLPGVLVGLSWFLTVWLLDRDRFYSQYIVQETLGKRGGNGSSAAHMWLDFMTFLAPFLLLIPTALFNLKKLANSRLIFLVCWCVIPACFFSYFPYRTETYLFILLPAFALLLDWVLKSNGSFFQRWAFKLNGLLVGFLGICGGLLLGTTGLANILCAILLGLAGTAFMIQSCKTELGVCTFERVTWAGLAVVLGVRLCAASMGEKDVADLRAISEANPQRKLVFLDEGRNIWHEIGLLSVTLGRPAVRLFSAESAIKELRDRSILVLYPDQSLNIADKSEIRQMSWWRLQRKFVVPTWHDLRQVAANESRREFKVYLGSQK